MCVIWWSARAQRPQTVPLRGGGERGEFGAGGRALCGGGVVLQFGRLLRWFGI